MKINIKKVFFRFFYPSILVLAVFLFYFPTTRSFYQQDEWLGYGLYLAKGVGTILQSTGGIWGVIFGQGRILTNLLMYIFYKFWPLNVALIAIFAMVIHSINVLIVFLLARKIFKKDIPAFLGSMFFAASSVAQSAISWPAASVNTLPSTTLILLAIYFFFRYFDLNNKKWLFGSFILLYISLFFKETGIFLFLLLPIYSFYNKRQNLRDYIKTYWYFIALVMLIVVFRIWGFKSDSGQVALFLTGSSKYFFDSIVIRSFLYPLTSFSLSLVPPEPFLNFARYITNVYYPFIPEGQFILVAQTIVLDLLSIMLSAAVGFVLVPFFKMSEVRVRKNMVFWVVFLLASFLPYVIISKSYSYLESRYYYVAAVAWSIVFVWLLNVILEKYRSLPIKFVVISMYLLFIYWHISVLTKDLDLVVKESQERIQILNQILQIKPSLTSNKNIFYVTGDTDYLLPGNKVPFQQGFGYTLLALYLSKSDYPKSFANNTELFEIGKEGYFEENGYGFGYFTDKKKFELLLKEKDPQPIELYYDSKKREVYDITKSVKNK